MLKHNKQRINETFGSSQKHKLNEIYQMLLARYGQQHWWPADSPFEVILGAILTQSASWQNVEKAMTNLKQSIDLTPASIRNLPSPELAKLIYPSGYYNAKTLKLKAFCKRLKEAYRDSLEVLFSLDISGLRSELLTIHGIGPETADSIILYAAEKPIFVIDAYTRRIMSRAGIVSSQIDYLSCQSLFMENLPHDEKLFNEYHALIVRHGKQVCRKVPQCSHCCLEVICPYQTEKEDTTRKSGI